MVKKAQGSFFTIHHPPSTTHRCIHHPPSTIHHLKEVPHAPPTSRSACDPWPGGPAPRRRTAHPGGRDTLRPQQRLQTGARAEDHHRPCRLGDGGGLQVSSEGRP